MSVEGIEKFANILGADTVKKIYEDGLSQSVQETGKISTDLIKSARLFTAPFQFMGAWQDRLSKYCDKIREGVPEERQIEAPSSLSGPIMDRLKYLEEDNYLTDLYISLLQRAIDKERVNEAHPAFFHIIDQLSPDEAFLLYSLSEQLHEYEYITELIVGENDTVSLGKRTVVRDLRLKNKLLFSEHFEMYISHLVSLNLVDWPIISEEPLWEDGQYEPKRKQTGIYTITKIHLTKFGELFVKACIPADKIFILK
ncbi:Abi-alpha family protein [Flavobacterium sp. 3-210]